MINSVGLLMPWTTLNLLAKGACGLDSEFTNKYKQRGQRRDKLVDFNSNNLKHYTFVWIYTKK